MLVYIAGKWEEKPEVRKIRKIFGDAGIDVISVWLDSRDVKSPAGLRNQAMIDFCSLMECEALVMVLVNEENYTSSSPNRYVEMGICLGKRIPVYIIGDPRPDEIFHRLPWVKRNMSVEEVIADLLDMSKDEGG